MESLEQNRDKDLIFTDKTTRKDESVSGVDGSNEENVVKSGLVGGSGNGSDGDNMMFPKGLVDMSYGDGDDVYIEYEEDGYDGDNVEGVVEVVRSVGVAGEKVNGDVNDNDSGNDERVRDSETEKLEEIFGDNVVGMPEVVRSVGVAAEKDNDNADGNSGGVRDSETEKLEEIFGDNVAGMPEVVRSVGVADEKVDGNDNVSGNDVRVRDSGKEKIEEIFGVNPLSPMKLDETETGNGDERSVALAENGEKLDAGGENMVEVVHGEVLATEEVKEGAFRMNEGSDSSTNVEGGGGSCCKMVENEEKVDAGDEEMVEVVHGGVLATLEVKEGGSRVNEGSDNLTNVESGGGSCGKIVETGDDEISVSLAENEEKLDAGDEDMVEILHGRVLTTEEVKEGASRVNVGSDNSANVDDGGGSSCKMVETGNEQPEISVENLTSIKPKEMDNEDQRNVLFLENKEMVDIRVEEDGKDERMGDEEHELSVGDFVWGKRTSRSWWPGQVYDPSDASNTALKSQLKDQLLVAYFGDNTFEWCYPFQLKPFETNFSQILNQSTNSKSFLNAVKRALEEIGRRVECELVCSCVPLDHRKKLERQAAKNEGIKKGVVAPDNWIGEHMVTQYDSAKFLECLRDISEDVSVANMLQTIVFKSWLSAYNRVKGFCQVPLSALVPLEDELNPEVGKSSARSKAQNLEKKASPSNIAATLSKKNKAKVNHKDLFGSRKNASQFKKRKNTEIAAKEVSIVHDGVNGKNKTSSFSRERKKSKYLSYPYTAVGEGLKSLMPVKDDDPEIPEVSTLTRESSVIKQSDDAIQKVVKQISLMDMLTELKCTAFDCMYLKGNPSSKEVKVFFTKFRSSVFGKGPDCETVINDLNRRCCKKRKSYNAESDSVKKDIDESNEPISIAIPKKMKTPTGKESALRSRKTSSSVVQVSESKLGQKAIGVPMYLTEEDNGEKKKQKGKKKAISQGTSGGSKISIASKETNGVTNIHASSKGKLQQKKGKSKEVAASQSSGGRLKNIARTVNFGTEAKDIANEQNIRMRSTPNAKKTNNAKTTANVKKSNSVKTTANAKKRKNVETTEISSSGAILLTFASGISLPSKDDLIKLFSRFGALNEAETRVMENFGCARVVYTRRSDAEDAFNSLNESNPFGSAVISYGVEYLPVNSLKASPAAPVNRAVLPPPAGEATPLFFIRQSLEMMTSMLEKSGENLSPDVKANLESDISSLLKKVTTMV